MEKRKDLVVYKNEFNKIPLKHFTASEMDLLFVIMSQMRNKGIEEVKFYFDDLKDLSKYNKQNAISSFIKDLESTYDKLISLNVKLGTATEFTKFVFFTKYSVSAKDQTVNIKVNEEFSHLINELTGSFTKIELDEITSLKSTYSKNMYRLLKQFKATGYATYDLETFKELLDIPESYSIGNITQRVLNPIMEELPIYFKNLRYNKIKGKGANKRRIVRLEFLFMPDDGLKEGKRTFRDENGEYYEKYISDFTEEEIKKAYP